MELLQNSIGRRLKRINNALDCRRTKTLQALDLTSSQAFLLGYLYHHRDADVYPGDLAKSFGLKHSTVSGLLGRLEAKGFLQFEDAKDRRKKKVVLTPKAIACHKKMGQLFAENERLITEPLSAEQQQSLIQLLDLVMQSLAVEQTQFCPIREEESHV